MATAWWFSCLMAIMMLGIDSIFALDHFANTAATSYWEKRLHGTRMTPSLRAMVSPLNASNVTQLGKDIAASNGQYFPANAASFCKAAHMECGTDEDMKAFEKSASVETSKVSGDLENNIFILWGGEGLENNIFILWGGEGKQPADKGEGKEQENNFIFENRATVVKRSEISTPAKSTPSIHDGAEDRRSLMSSSDHELNGRTFLLKQALVGGIDIYENFGSFHGDAEVDKVAGRAFLPRKLARLFPLQNGAKIASMLGIPHPRMPKSSRFCKGSLTAIGEVKACVSSIEDLADLISSMLGAPPGGIVMYDAITNASHVTRHEAGDRFHVLKVEALPGDGAVTCHDLQDLPFRVFLCHSIKQSRYFQATLQGEDGHIHQRVAVCHFNTSTWNPHHQAFVELKTKPGESEVCHWLSLRTLRPISWVFLRGVAEA